MSTAVAARAGGSSGIEGFVLSTPAGVRAALERLKAECSIPGVTRALVDAVVELTGAGSAVVAVEGRRVVAGAPTGIRARCFPLDGAAQRVGTLTVAGRPLTERQVRVIELLAVHAAVAVERVRAAGGGATRPRPRAERDRFEDVVERIVHASPAGAMTTLVEAAASLFDAAGAVLLLPAPPDGTLEPVAATGVGVAGAAAVHASARSRSSPFARALARRTTAAGLVDLDGPTARHAVCAPLLVGGVEVGVLAILDAGVPDGRRLRRRLRDLADVSAGAVDRANRARVDARVALLGALTDALADAVARRDVFAAALAAAREGLGASSGLGFVLGEGADGLELVHADGCSLATSRALRSIPLGSAAPAAACVRDRREILVEGDEGLEPGGAVAALPLRRDERVLGAIVLAFSAPRLFDGEDRRFGATLARLAAQALDRAERSRRRDRTDQIAALAAELAGAGGIAAVSEAVAAQVARHLGAGRVAVVVAEESKLRTAAAWPPDDALAPVGTVGAELRPLVEAAVAAGRTLAEPAPAGEESSLRVAAGLRAHGNALGAIVLDLPGAHALDADVRAYVEAVAGLTGSALARALLFDRLLASTEELEVSQRRLLASGQRMETTLRSLRNSRQALRRSRDYLRTLLDRLQIGVVVVGARSLRVEYANQDACDLLGVPDGLVGEPVVEPWPELSLREFVRSRLAVDGPTWVPLELADGQRIELIGLAHGATVLLVLRDVTRNEREAQAARDFVKTASHELRAPLASIAYAVDALRIGAAADERVRTRFLDAIAGETAQLTALTHALLRLARAQDEPEAVARARTPLRPLLEEVVGKVTVTPGVEVMLRCPRSLAALVDRALLESAVLNLVQNAARHTEHGTIVVSGRRARDGVVEVEVVDSGSGIDPGRRLHLFDGVHENGSDSFGIGLPLARRIARSLGGDLALTSTPGIGTSVTLTVGAAD